MWDTKSRFTTQSSAWCGMASVSGSGLLSKVSASTSDNTSGFRQNDPAMRRWQSLSYLAPEVAPRSFPGAEFWAARGESSYGQSELVEWLQDAHERLDTQLDLLRSRDAQLNYNITAAQLLDIKHKQAMSALEQKKEEAELSQFEKSRQRRKLHEKVQQLEKDLLQMRSTLNKRSHIQSLSPEKTVSLSRTLPVNQQDLTRQKDETQLCKLRAALKESEARAKTQEEERNNALQKLQTSTEAERKLLNQIEEMMQRLNHAAQNHSEVQEQLSEANNKISQVCLEKAVLSTQVLKLEDNIKELKASLSGALSDKDHLIQANADLQQRAQLQKPQLERIQPGSESCDQQTTTTNNNQETVLLKEETKALSEVNEKLTCELEMVSQRLETSLSQIQELTSEKIMSTKQITDLEAERLQLIREKEELLIKMNDGGHKELTEMKEKCHQLGESLEALELEKQKLQERCLCLESAVLEKEEKLHQQKDDYQRQDATSVQKIQELRAVASYWTEKWKKVAQNLQSTQEEIEELKKNNTRNKKESDSLLRVELDACKQELELERSRSQVLLHRCKDKGEEAAQTQDKDTVTDLNISSQTESYLLWDPTLDSHSSQNKSSQVKDNNSSVDGKKDKTFYPINIEVDQHRRMVTEQSAVDRRSWQHGSGLMPVFEEDEESEDWPGRKEEEPAEEAQAETNIHNQSLQMSAMSAEIRNLEAKNDNLLQDIRFTQPIHEFPATAKKESDKSSDVGVSSLSHISNEFDLQWRSPSLYPDGVFLAELVDICSPDEEEDKED
ncbi:hypothetical protein PAMP_019906 [Pampus punctatissimus]